MPGPDRDARPPQARRARPFFRPSVADEVGDELDFHLEMRARDLVARGLAPEAARAEALRRFGDVARAGAECRAIGDGRDRALRLAEWWGALRQDAAYAVRTLLRTPAVTFVAVLTLALGIGATTTIFSALYSVVLRPYPFAEPERVLLVFETWRGDRGAASAAHFADWKAETRSFAALAAVRYASVNLADEQAPERVVGARVTDDFFRAFGERPALGRTFLPEEQAPGRDGVAVLSHRLWTRRFAADPGVVGRTVRVGGTPRTIVGVMPARFDYTADGEELWLPAAITPAQRADYGEHSWTVVGRLGTGVTQAGALADLEAVTRRIAERQPRLTAQRGVDVERLDHVMVEEHRPRLLTLLGAVGLVLLIACGNVANLLLARGAARGKEVALRAALGAGRGRIVRQLLTESLVLALAGAAAGIALAYLGLGALVAQAPQGVPRLEQARIDGVALAFALGLAAATSVLAGLAPALRAARPAVYAALREGGRAARGGAVPDGVRGALVVGEVALALTLLVGAGLLVRSALRLQEVDAGFDPRGVLTARVTLPAAQYGDSGRAGRAIARMEAALAARADVRAAAVTTAVPLGPGHGSSNGLTPEGKPDAVENVIDAGRSVVTPGYFATMRVPLRRGRLLTAADAAGAPRVMVVSETLARRAFGDADPIGRRIACCDGEGPARWKEVVGVVGDVRGDGLARDARPRFYLPAAQVRDQVWEWSNFSVILVARGGGDAGALAPAIRGAVKDVDAALPVFDVRPMTDRVRGSLAAARFNTLLLGALGVVGLVLAAVGVYGVIAYLVGQRAQEFGVRITLGATTRDVLLLVARQGLGLVLAGVAVGVAGALAASRVLADALYGVAPTDPLTFAAVAALLVAVGVAASVVPARRASRVSPVEVLREG